MTTIPEALATLAQSPDHIVLHRVPNHNVVYRPRPVDSGRVFRGAILDTETTGLTADDTMIEVAIVSFEYDARGIIRIVDVVDELQDPGAPLKPDITALTGLTDADLAGKQFDKERIEGALHNARLIIAHNAGFDRPHMERVFPVAADKPWACSQAQLPWVKEYGMGSSRLEYLLMRHGFFYEAHRAETDCRALLHLLTKPAPGWDGKWQLFQVLRDQAAKPSLHVWLVDLPFDKKDAAKAAGYVWSDGSAPGSYKAWHKDIATPQEAQEALEAIKSWYRRQALPVVVTTQTAATRFSQRKVAAERIDALEHLAAEGVIAKARALMDAKKDDPAEPGSGNLQDVVAADARKVLDNALGIKP